MLVLVGWVEMEMVEMVRVGVGVVGAGVVGTATALGWAVLVGARAVLQAGTVLVTAWRRRSR